MVATAASIIQNTWAPANTYADFCLFILWMLNHCYCVKYIRIVLFMIFCITQGSTVTHFKYGGKYGMGFCFKFHGDYDS